uniref:Uncharacterized protein n=1 Tax=Meloidogyne enterolobii TaxID=390850 RepID=A0A6V7U682_MELEN|nr:unnamed protein product [Meloidogyne enterolobii]
MFQRNSSYVLAIFLGNFGLGLLHTAFNFYYVKVFLNIFQVNEYWFNLAQLLFLIWNAINDPLFGYLQGKDFYLFWTFFCHLFLDYLVSLGNKDSPPYVEGIHLIVSLFFYDAFFSCIGVAWSALYSDTTRDHRKRVKGIKFAQLASLCSVNVITITEKVSGSLEKFEIFQYVCVTLATISLCCLFLTGWLANTQRDNKTDVNENLMDKDELGRKMKQVLSSKDFQYVVFTNFVHTCRTTAHMNFASIATDILIPQSILPKGSLQLSAFFAACTVIPQLLVIFNDKLLLRSGAYLVYFYGIIASICSTILYIFSSNPYAVLLFMLVDSITVHSTSPLFNILLSEVIEEDKIRYSRKNPISSLIFSLNALIVKPAISIAPVIIVFLLNRNGYTLYQKEQIRSLELRSCMANVIFSTPLILGALEYWIFRRYSLRHKHSLVGLPI